MTHPPKAPPSDQPESGAASPDPLEPEGNQGKSGPSDARAPGGAACIPSGKIAAALAIGSGFLYFVAFPGIDIWPLAFVALVPLIVALRGQTPKRGLWLGWLAGFTMTMLGFYWLLEMLQVFSGFPTALCVVFVALVCAYQAGRIALLGWLVTRAEARGWPFGPVFAVGFAASELLFPLLFPWYYGATVHQLPLMMQTAELGGPIAVALVLVAANLAIAELVFARLQRRRVGWQKVALLLAVPAVAAVYGAIRIPQVDARVGAAPKARVGLVQANMSLMAKRRDRSEGLRRHLELTRELQQGGKLDLVVWSETSVAGAVYEKQAAEFYRRLFTARLGVPAIFGAVLTRDVDDARGRVFFNSALLTDETGQMRGRYDKVFLLAFGEYLPFGDTFPFLYELSPHSSRFSKGQRFEPLQLGEHEIVTFICYEDISPAFVNNIVKHAKGDPDLLVNITNDAWFGDTTEPWIHLALSKFRAIEQRRFFVRSTNSGVSAFVDPVGRVLSHTPTFERAAIAEQIAWLQGSTPFRLWGNAPWWLVSIASILMAFIPRPRSWRRR